MTVTIILVILSFYLLAKASEANQRKRAAKRAEAERQRRQAEARQIIEEQRRAERERKEMARRQVEMDREMLRIVTEQKRQAREQKRQAEIIRKHEQRISDLEYRMRQAESDIAHWKETVGNLYALRDVAQNELDQAIIGGKNQTKYQKQIITLDNQIHSAESRLAKAQYAKAKAERELQAA